MPYNPRMISITGITNKMVTVVEILEIEFDAISHIISKFEDKGCDSAVLVYGDGQTIVVHYPTTDTVKKLTQTKILESLSTSIYGGKAATFSGTSVRLSLTDMSIHLGKNPRANFIGVEDPERVLSLKHDSEEMDWVQMAVISYQDANVTKNLFSDGDKEEPSTKIFVVIDDNNIPVAIIGPTKGIEGPEQLVKAVIALNNNKINDIVMIEFETDTF
jgi:hypothetical protein